MDFRRDSPGPVACTLPRSESPIAYGKRERPYEWLGVFWGVERCSARVVKAGFALLLWRYLCNMFSSIHMYIIYHYNITHLHHPCMLSLDINSHLVHSLFYFHHWSLISRDTILFSYSLGFECILYSSLRLSFIIWLNADVQAWYSCLVLRRGKLKRAKKGLHLRFVFFIRVHTSSALNLGKSASRLRTSLRLHPRWWFFHWQPCSFVMWFRRALSSTRTHIHIHRSQTNKSTQRTNVHIYTGPA